VRALDRAIPSLSTSPAKTRPGGGSGGPPASPNSASILLELGPGAWSSQRHWHALEDEFVYVLKGRSCSSPTLARGLIEAAANLQYLTGEPVLATLGQSHRYHRRVFLTPPWPQIYSTDPERRHSLEKALPEYRLLLETYPSLGYDCQGLGCRNVPTSSSMHWQRRCHRRLSGRTPAVLGVSWRTAGIGAIEPSRSREPKAYCCPFAATHHRLSHRLSQRDG
jgi:hypothetical protein